MTTAYQLLKMKTVMGKVHRDFMGVGSLRTETDSPPAMIRNFPAKLGRGDHTAR